MFDLKIELQFVQEGRGRGNEKISKSYFIPCLRRRFLPSNQSYILLPPTRDANISISSDYVKTEMK